MDKLLYIYIYINIGVHIYMHKYIYIYILDYYPTIKRRISCHLQ